MDGIGELAQLFKERENGAAYAPLIGRVVDLPDLKIRIGERILLSARQLKFCIPPDGLELGREVVLLPYSKGQKFVVMGVIL